MKATATVEVLRCNSCRYEWTAVFPMGKTSDLCECPVCHKVAGVPR